MLLILASFYSGLSLLNIFCFYLSCIPFLESICFPFIRLKIIIFKLAVVFNTTCENRTVMHNNYWEFILCQQLCWDVFQIPSPFVETLRGGVYFSVFTWGYITWQRKSWRQMMKMQTQVCLMQNSYFSLYHLVSSLNRTWERKDAGAGKSNAERDGRGDSETWKVQNPQSWEMRKDSSCNPQSEHVMLKLRGHLYETRWCLALVLTV